MFRLLRSRLPVGRYFGIGVYIHWSFFLLPIIVLILMSNSPAQSDPSPIFVPTPLFVMTLLGALFFCVVLHEYGHALTARVFGIGTRDITLYPIGGIARLERMSEKPIEEIIIAVAGPAVNVVIVIVLGIVFVFAALLFQVHSFFRPLGQPTVVFFLMMLAGSNLALIVFNMLPAFPMDGGRVFRAFLALFMDRLDATRVAVRVGVVMAILIGLAGVLSHQYFVPVVAAFVFFAGQMELRYLEWKRHMEQQEPLEVRPVRRASVRESVNAQTGWTTVQGSSSDSVFRPNIVVHTWDEKNKEWVKDNYSQD